MSAPRRDLPPPALSVPFITTFPTPPALTEAGFSGMRMEAVIPVSAGFEPPQLRWKVTGLLLSQPVPVPHLLDSLEVPHPRLWL